MYTIKTEQKWVREDASRKIYTTVSDYEDYGIAVAEFDTACKESADLAITLSTIKLWCTVTLHRGDELINKFKCDNIH